MVSLTTTTLWTAHRSHRSTQKPTKPPKPPKPPKPTEPAQELQHPYTDGYSHRHSQGLHQGALHLGPEGVPSSKEGLLQVHEGVPKGLHDRQVH